MTELEFDSAEWRSLTATQRIERCLKLAEQAKLLAASAEPELREAYQEVSQQWLALANEIETNHPDSASSDSLTF